MKNYLFLIPFTIAFSACSASTESNLSSKQSSTTSNSQTANIETLKNTSSNTITVVEAEKKSQEVFNNGGNTDAQKVASNPLNEKDNSYKGRPAPDDSTFQSSMNAKGQFLETRTFKNHPQLAKVERYVAEKKILVYLKTGKIIEVPEDKLPTFQATVPGTILEAAGVKLIESAPEGMKDGTKVDQKKTN